LDLVSRVEVAGKGISTRARSGGGGVNDDGDAPAADVGEEPAEAVTMAAEVNAGEHRGVDAVH
jgi:hypothetical protein